MMTDCFAWGESRPGPAGWYAVVLMFGQLMKPAARKWDGERWTMRAASTLSRVPTPPKRMHWTGQRKAAQPSSRQRLAVRSARPYQAFMPTCGHDTRPLLQLTSVRTRLVDDKSLIGLKHMAKAIGGLPVSSTWVEMPPDDVGRLINMLQETLAKLDRA